MKDPLTIWNGWGLILLMFGVFVLALWLNFAK